MDLRLELTPKLAIVGRPNVGKSTLFNKIIGRRRALESPTAGTTTDINFALADWRGRPFTVIDTAGLDLSSNTATPSALKHQAHLAMTKANVIVLVVDALDGLTLPDRALAKELKRARKPIILVINKVDGKKQKLADQNPDLLKLGYGQPIAVSAITGAGVGDLLDLVLNTFEKLNLLEQDLPTIDARVALIGKPNVGKSSIMNALAGEERVIVSEIPHTTKEPQDTLISWSNQLDQTSNLLFVDTVGIRKQAHIAPGLEKTGVILSLKELDTADVAILVIDSTLGAELQDKKISRLIEERKSSLLIAVNKWDLAKAQGVSRAEDYQKYLALRFPFLKNVPIIFMSAKTGHGVKRLIPMILKLNEERHQLINQDALDTFIIKLKKLHHAKAKGLNRPKIYGLSQTSDAPPTFTIVVDDKDKLHPSFLKFVENAVRSEFDFTGTPVRLNGREIV